MYLTRDSESGNSIDVFTTAKEAEAEIKKYEEEDKSNGNYSDDFYDVYDDELEEVVS